MDLFSVCQFFPDGSHEYVRQGVGAEEAVNAAIHYATCVGARLGTTVRVIITDSGDSIAWEWKRDDGITFGAAPEHLGKLKHGQRSAA
ncbi:hypothetical protein [Phenylobacterium sp.]|uniref:hypothetical protein n=1 Tax=Phenylobacterium sp. TaxID=1871053 RepID=UPI003962F13D